MAVTDDVPADAVIIGGVGELAATRRHRWQRPRPWPSTGKWRCRLALGTRGRPGRVDPVDRDARHPDGSSALIVLTPSLNEPATAAVLVVDTPRGGR